MREQITLRFKRNDANTYTLLSSCFEEFDSDGKLAEIEIEDEGRKARKREMKSRIIAGARDWQFPDLHTPNIIALALVRVAQWRFVRMIDAPDMAVAIFHAKNGSKIVTQYHDLHRGATRREGHRPKWLQEMLSLPGDSDEIFYGGRLKKWFSVSTKPTELVRCNLIALPPTSITIIADSEEVSELELDNLESYLSRRLGAGYPSHIEIGGVTLAGSPPSVQPDVIVQENEAQQILEIYSSAEVAIVCIKGDSTTGKTTFASHWLRRLIGNRKLRQKLVFSWSFSRQGVAAYLPLPLTEFFAALANALEIKLGETATRIEQAKAILGALRVRPTFLFLDGLEAVFHNPEPHSENTRPLKSEGIGELLVGLAGQSGTFVLATSKEPIDTVFGLTKSRVQHIRLSEIPLQNVAEILKSLQEPSAITGCEEPEKRSRDRGKSSEDTKFSIARADMIRVLRKISGCHTNAEFVGWLKRRRAEAELSDNFLLPIPAPPFDEFCLSSLGIIIRELRGTLELLLFYVLCTCQAAIEEEALLSVAASLPPSEIPRETPSPVEWAIALDSLIATTILEQPSRQNYYSVHSSKRRAVSDSLAQNKPRLWIAINKCLGTYLLEHSPKLPSTREELPPLINAGIHFCQADEKLFAYKEIGFNRLSRGLTGYSVYNLGEYEAFKGLIHAMLEDEDVLGVSSLPPDVESLCILVNALCLRFLNDLEGAWREHSKAWSHAQKSDEPMVMFPVGFTLMRLCHILGKLPEATKIETILTKLIRNDEIVKVGKKLLRLKEVPHEIYGQPAAIQDGASSLTSMIGLNRLYRGDFWGTRGVDFFLSAGIKECKDNGAEFKVLMPSFGRLWHALALLEMGRWEQCEKAYHAEEMRSDVVRYRQTGSFEAFTAKMFLLKAKTLTGASRLEALTSAIGFADLAARLADDGAYCWWQAFSSLVQAEIFMLDRQHELAQERIGRALQLSETNSLQMLNVDALLARGELARSLGLGVDARRDGLAARALADKLGYAIRNKAIRALIKAGQ